jgi:galactokinase/mevalonate kinase-like predicted kinase
VEGCRVGAALRLEGENVVVGAEIDRETSLPHGACLDILPGFNRRGEPTTFVRFYSIGDAFRGGADDTYCGRPLAEWLAAAGAAPADVWDPTQGVGDRSIWTARLFPEGSPSDYLRWQWMLRPEGATAAQKTEWLAAGRWSMAEMAAATDREAFQRRRTAIRAALMRRELGAAFARESRVSAAEIAYLVCHGEEGVGLLADMLAEARRHDEGFGAAAPLDRLALSRIVHTVGSVVERLAGGAGRSLGQVLPGLPEALSAELREWLGRFNLRPTAETPAGAWSGGLHGLAFERLARTICSVEHERMAGPAAAMRSDEIVWGRAPARLDLSGGWTDTPPYSLEFGGCVLNAAVNLNGQPPVQAFARLIDEPVIRLASIDCGTRTEIGGWEQLLDFRAVASEFALAKAALALSGFAVDGGRPVANRTLGQLLEAFGGGIELTTLAAVPKGSGLGTSSIMGAVLLAVLDRVVGRATEPQQLFHRVLQLEQAMTTGGGWQDQIGGVTDGVKYITTSPGMVPEAVVEYVPGEIIEPAENGGQTLLYYTGITRLAKNILEQVVGRYLDRDRATMTTLTRIGALAAQASAAMARRDLAELGRAVGTAWQLNKRLDPGSSNAAVEALQERVRPFVHGAKLLGAGGGGFLFLVCRSTEAAQQLRSELESDPPNSRARFFQYSVNREGLRVTAC